MLDTHDVNSDDLEVLDAETRVKYEHLKTISERYGIGTGGLFWWG